MVEATTFHPVRYDGSMGFLVLLPYFKTQSQKLLGGLIILASSSIWAQTTPVKASIPKAVSGYALEDIVSCVFLDRIPSKFKNDGRTTKLLIKDQLRLSSELEAVLWEVHQIMDQEGFVTFVLRRPVGNGEWESFAFKELQRIHTIGTSSGRNRMKKVQDIKALIDRPVMTLENSKGSTVSVIPSSSGVVTLSIQLSKGEGRLLPPVFVRGSTCERPADEVNSSGAFNPAGGANSSSGVTPKASK